SCPRARRPDLAIRVRARILGCGAREASWDLRSPRDLPTGQEWPFAPRRWAAPGSAWHEALGLDARELLFRHVTRRGSRREAGVAGVRDLRVALLHRAHQVLERLVHDAVRADLARDLLRRAVLGDELVLRAHVDAVDARMPQRRRDRGEVDLARAGAARELDDLPARVAAHDRVVHQQHVLALELELDRVALVAHGGLALALAVPPPRRA